MALSEEVKKLIIADYYTGQYSQRDLAKKHNVSIGTINKITKDLDTKNEHFTKCSKNNIISIKKDIYA